MCCHCMNRREFLGVTTAMTLAAAAGASARAAAAWSEGYWDPAKPLYTQGRTLRVQPVLMYRVPVKREMTSYKSWGGVQSDEAAAEETARITEELNGLAASSGFPMEVLPVIRVKTKEEAAAIDPKASDATIVYPATGSGETLNACIPDRGAVIFARHKSGPVYYWYEALSTRYLASDKDAEKTEKRASVHDVVIDDLEELRWRLRALYAVHNFLGCRIVALGGPAGKYAGEAPQVARDKWGMDLVDYSYDDLSKRIASALADPAAVAVAEKWTDTFLALPGTTLETERPFVVNAFLLYGLFKDILAEHDASVFTIKECMSTILPMSKTTACLSLGLMNDEGLTAFCESDFVVVPAGVLLRYVSGRPVFMHNSTFPHDGVVTCAHCASPRRLDGDRYEPTRILTHYESDFGAAPKVDMPVGQLVSFIDPEYATGRWVGLKGEVVDNPFLEICRSQQDVRVHGDWKKLLHEVRDSHWMMAYGDHLREVGYAAAKIGVTWDNISGEA
ncbi:MAG TPA: sugar isomerase [Candidatus Hydrogenedentes bacterium]|nr:sugar isomerase [Candidatus Hydrogenedentota bacterium]